MFVAHARSLLGARWRHRGRKPWALDCVGLLVLSAHAAGWPLIDERYYGREPWDSRLQSQLMEQFGDVVPAVEDWRPGDVALIRWRKGEPTHVAIIGDYIHGGLSLIHCQNIGGCVEHAFDEYFFSCIVEVYRWHAKSSL